MEHLRPNPALPRVAVIGAGVVGAAIALRLAEQGIEALLLDREPPGSGATGASYAAVHAHQQTPRAFFDLCRAAMEEYRRLAWHLAPAPWYYADGSLLCFRDAAQAAALRAQVQRLRDWGYVVEVLSPPEVAADLEPGLAVGDLDPPIAWFPQEAWVAPRVLTRRLAQGARNAGGRVLTGPEREVVAIGGGGGRVSSVTLRGGQTIPVGVVVNAAGVDAGRIAGLVERRLPLLEPRSLVVRAGMPDGSDPLRRPIGTDQIAMRPDGPGRVYLVAQVDPDDAPPGPIPLDDPRVTAVITGASDTVPALAAAQPEEACIALWPLMEDGLPCIGPVSEIPGYYEAVTDYGVTLAPLIARSLADEILGQPGNPLLGPFLPDRVAAQ